MTVKISRYDGGDCCSCTCTDDAFQCGNSGFDCDDPATECFGEFDPIYTTYTDGNAEDEAGCTPSWISDGFCDSINNTDECRYGKSKWGEKGGGVLICCLP